MPAQNRTIPIPGSEPPEKCGNARSERMFYHAFFPKTLYIPNPPDTEKRPLEMKARESEETPFPDREGFRLRDDEKMHRSSRLRKHFSRIDGEPSVSTLQKNPV
jgi:hypothetical protein